MAVFNFLSHLWTHSGGVVCKFLQFSSQLSLSYLWKTKRESLSTLKLYGHDDIWALTDSFWMASPDNLKSFFSFLTMCDNISPKSWWKNFQEEKYVESERKTFPFSRVNINTQNKNTYKPRSSEWKQNNVDMYVAAAEKNSSGSVVLVVLVFLLLV